MDWFTADLMLGTGFVIPHCKRPFLTDFEKEQLAENPGEDIIVSTAARAAMDSDFIESINNYVEEDDNLIILGNFCTPAGEYIPRVQYYLDLINCKNLYLIGGQFDSESQLISYKLHSDDDNFFKAIRFYDVGKIKDKHCIFTSRPEVFWDGCTFLKSWNIYGGTFGTLEAWLNKHMPGRLSMCVSIDKAYQDFDEYRPYSADEVYKFLEGRPGYTYEGAFEKSMFSEFKEKPF